MIAVTGAAGKTGLAIVGALAMRGVQVRGLVRREEDGTRVMATGGAACVVGDVADAAALEKLLTGVTALYHICPNMHPDEERIGAKVLAAALAAGVQHVVYHSVLHPQTSEMPHHWQKLLVEERIFASGIPFTILQPTAYMQNLLAYWPSVRQAGNFAVPYPVTTRLSLVALQDVAAVAARVLTEAGHAGAIYELVGSTPLTQLEVAAVMSAHVGRAVTVNEVSVVAWERQAGAGGLGDYAVQTLGQMFRYYAQYGLVGNPNVLRWLLGREPTSLEAFIAETMRFTEQ